MNFIAVRIHALIGLKKNNIKISELFTGALSTPPTKDIVVNLKAVEVVYSG